MLILIFKLNKILKLINKCVTEKKWMKYLENSDQNLDITTKKTRL